MKYKYTISYIAALIICVFIARDFYRDTFSTKKWMENPYKRPKMVDDILEKDKLEGKTKYQVLSLLGTQDVFDKENDCYFYELKNGKILKIYFEHNEVITTEIVD